MREGYDFLHHPHTLTPFTLNFFIVVNFCPLRALKNPLKYVTATSEKWFFTLST